MRNGFIFKDRHSSDFGVTVRTKSRPILPSVKENIDVYKRQVQYNRYNHDTPHEHRKYPRFHL